MRKTKLDKSGKKIFFHKIFHEGFDNIEKRINEWFVDVYISNKDEESSTDLLKTDLDYMFDGLFFNYELMESCDIEDEDNKKHLNSYYRIYTKSDTSFKQFILDIRYDRENDRLRTISETDQAKKEWDDAIDEILKDI